MGGPQYLDKPEQWQAVADYARKTKLMGLDTETYGHDIKKTTAAYRAKVHVWSVAFRTGQMHPRGYHVARGAVLPREALTFQPLRDVLSDAEILKPAHNGHHDQHALDNEGVTLAGMVDTLDLARLAWAERAMDKTQGFRLKPLSYALLGKPHRPEYYDVTHRTLVHQIWKNVPTCQCGVAKCRKRKQPEHTKIPHLVGTTKEVTEEYALETIVPGHVQWNVLVPYAAADAEDSVELQELALLTLDKLDKRLPPNPWWP